MSAVVQDSRPSAAAAAPYPPAREAWYIVCVLMICYVFSFIDRQIIGYLVEPIEHDLGMTDAQLGYLQGLYFALFYTFLGIPIARAADKFNRRNIMAVGVFLWSLAATFCGLAKSSLQLILGRMGVGVGEATLSPAAYSTMVDMFPREKQGGAFSVYNMGITIGSGLAALMSGIVVTAFATGGKTFSLPWVGELHGWQMAFIVTGGPGLLLPLLLMTIREQPRRGLITTKNAQGDSVVAKPSIFEVIKYTWKSGAFYSRHFFAWGFISMVGYGVGAWLPTSLYRSYGMNPGKTGILLGIGLLVINTPSVFMFGKLSDYLVRKGWRDGPVIMCLISTVCIGVLSAIPYAMPNLTLVWAMIYISSITFHGYVGLSPMIVSQVTPNQMRAQVSSLCLFVVNMLGLGLGPSVPTFFNWLLFNNDKANIRWGLTVSIILGAAIASLLYATERKHYKAKLDEAATWR